MPIYAIWFVAALALLVLELASTTFFSIFLAFGAFAAGLLAFVFPDSAVWFQAVLAIVVAMLGVVLGRPFLRQRLRRQGEPPLTPGVHGGFVGQRALAARRDRRRAPPGPRPARRRDWLAFSDDHQPIPTGAPVIVTAVRGTTLAVRPAVRVSRIGELDMERRLIPLVVAFIIAILFVAVRVLPAAQHGQSRPAGVRRGDDPARRVPGDPRAGPGDHRAVHRQAGQRRHARVPAPGDRQEVITKDNVVVSVNATIFTQVVDAKQALFSIANFDVAIDALARTALRSVIGTLSLDEALSERERINVDVQEQMEAVTDKWGIRINRIEIVEITPPPQILQALALQKQADQEKRAKILQSEGLQQSAVNVADGERQAAIKSGRGRAAGGDPHRRGTTAGGDPRGRGPGAAIETVYGAITAQNPNPTLVAILQLDTLSKFALSPNTKIVIPAESSALLGAAQAIQSVLAQVPAAE